MMSKIACLRGRNPFLRDVAKAIILDAGVPDHNYYQECVAIGTWVQTNIHYLRDVATEELLIDPLTLLDQASRGEAAADCDDHALLTAALLISIGSMPMFRAVRYSEDEGCYDHIYVVVYEPYEGNPEKRLVLDCIVKDKPMGSEIPHQSGQEYPAALNF